MELRDADVSMSHDRVDWRRIRSIDGGRESVRGRTRGKALRPRPTIGVSAIVVWILGDGGSEANGRRGMSSNGAVW